MLFSCRYDIIYYNHRQEMTANLQYLKQHSTQSLERDYKHYYFIIRGDDYMAGTTTNISIRMDADLKAQADALFAELGMNLSTAFNIFVRQSLREGRIPFDISLGKPNKETIAAMLEAERIAHDPSVKHYSDVEEQSTLLSPPHNSKKITNWQ